MSNKIPNLIPYTKDAEFNQAVLDNVPACVKLLDLDGRLIYLNSKGAELLELSDPESVMGIDWASTWQGNDQKAARRAIEVALNGGVGIFEGFQITEAGTPKWWDVTITALADDDGIPQRLLAISRDVTERHDRDAELAAKNLQLQKTIAKLKEKQRELDTAESMLDSLLRRSHSYIYRDQK